MKRILGIILAVLVCIAFFAFLVLNCVATGVALDTSILVVLIAIAVTLVVMGWIKLVLWLLF